MKIEIKNLQVAEFNSEETLCYQCSLWLNGEKVGESRNEGHGGMSYVEFSDPQIKTKVEAHVSTLPPQEFPAEWGGGTYNHNLDSWVDMLVDQAYQIQLTKKADAKLLRQTKTKTLFRIIGEKYKEGEYNILKVSSSDPRVPPYLNNEYGVDGWVMITCTADLKEVA